MDHATSTTVLELKKGEEQQTRGDLEKALEPQLPILLNITPTSFRISTSSSVTVGAFIHDEYDNHEMARKISNCSEKRQRRLSEMRRGSHSGHCVTDEKKLITAVNKGDCVAVQQLLQNGANPSCCDTKLRTPLHFAASKGHCDIVQLLLHHKADPNRRDTIGNTPLHLAACTSHIDVVTELLKAGTDIKAMDHSGRTPLKLARSRLNILYSDKTCANGLLKDEVTKVVEMMRAYVGRAHQPGDVDRLDALCSRLTAADSREQMDELGGLLDTFAHMTLERGHRTAT